MTRYPSRFSKSVPKRARDGTPREGDCPTHRKWIRQRPCVMHGEACRGRVEAAHVRAGTDGGMGKKPHDRWCVPLCSHHHQLQHALGETTFWQGINPRIVAQSYASRSPDPKVKT